MRRNRDFIQAMDDKQESFDSDDESFLMNQFENSVSVRIMRNIQRNLKDKIGQTHFLY